MNFPSTCLFGKSPAECRSVGARGGRARARNLRLRRAALSPTLAPAPEPEAETVHEASALLDERFPWLRDAFGPRRTKRAAILEVLRRDSGATLDEIAAAAGWPRCIAGTFPSAIGASHTVARLIRPDGSRAYRLAS